MKQTETRQVLQARCCNGRGPCRINFQFGLESLIGADITVPLACGIANCERHQHIGVVPDPADYIKVYGQRFSYEGPVPAKQAAGYMVYCLEHKSMMHFKPLKARFSDDPCSPECREATGGSCKCKCGGMNHGVDAI